MRHPAATRHVWHPLSAQTKKLPHIDIDLDDAFSDGDDVDATFEFQFRLHPRRICPKQQLAGPQGRGIRRSVLLMGGPIRTCMILFLRLTSVGVQSTLRRPLHSIPSPIHPRGPTSRIMISFMCPSPRVLHSAITAVQTRTKKQTKIAATTFRTQQSTLICRNRLQTV